MLLNVQHDKYRSENQLYTPEKIFKRCVDQCLMQILEVS